MTRRTYSFDDVTTGRLQRVADARYRGNQSSALRAAVEVLDRLLASEATATVDPLNAAALLAANAGDRQAT